MDESDMHMHRAVYTFLGKDHLQAAWTMVDAGELVETKRFDLVREQGR